MDMVDELSFAQDSIMQSVMESSEENDDLVLDKEKLTVLYGSIQINYEQQTLTPHGLEVQTIPNTPMMMFSKQECFQFDRRYVMISYCASLTDSLIKVINSLELVYRHGSVPVDFHHFALLVQKIPNQREALQHILQSLPQDMLMFIITQQPLFLMILMKIVRAVYGKDLSQHAKAFIVSESSTLIKPYERLMIINKCLPEELPLKNFLFGIVHKVVEKQLSQNKFLTQQWQDSPENYPPLSETTTQSISLIKSIYQLTSTSKGAHSLLQKFLLCQPYVHFLQSNFSRIYQQQSLHNNFLKLCSFLMIVQRDVVLRIWKQRQKEVEVMLISVIMKRMEGGRYGQQEYELKEEEFLALIESMGQWKPTKAITQKISGYLFQFLPNLRREQIRTLVQLLMKNRGIREAHSVTFIQYMQNTLEDLCQKPKIRKQKFLVLQMVKAVRFYIGEMYKFSEDFLRLLGQAIKKCGKSAEGCWKSIQKKVQQLKESQEEDLVKFGERILEIIKQI